MSKSLLTSTQLHDADYLAVLSYRQCVREAVLTKEAIAKVKLAHQYSSSSTVATKFASSTKKTVELIF